MEKDIKYIKTYFNRNGYPILRRCKNCIFWECQNEKTGEGFCTIKPYYFAFTLTPNLYPVTKEFFLCTEHKLYNENKLEEVSDSIPLVDAIKNKNDIS